MSNLSINKSEVALRMVGFLEHRTNFELRRPADVEDFNEDAFIDLNMIENED